MSLLSSLFLSWITAAMLSGSPTQVFIAGGRYAALAMAYFVILALGVYLFVINSEKATRDLKARLFRSYVRDSVESRIGGHSGEGIAAINTEADLATDMYGNALCFFAQCIMNIVFSAVVIFAVDWRLGLVSLVIGVISLIPQLHFAKPLSKISEERLQASAASVRKMSGILSGGASIRAFAMEERMAADFARDNAKLLALSVKESWIAVGQSLFGTLQGWLSLAGVFGVGGYLVATGRLDFASLMLVPSLSASIAQGMAGLGSTWAGMQGPIAACGRLSPLMQERKAPSGSDEGWERWNGDTALRIEGLNFRYLSAEANVLSGVSLAIGQNQCVAFVGHSGSGKSTLLRAIMGLYEREDLPVWMGNLKYGQVSARIWREKFAYVDQSCKLFDMTVAENIGLGRPGATQEEIEAAAAEAGADAFIRSLPQGYDTPCGERGGFLSGGQKQRIAIARALVRGAPILVFDEATSALDAATERQVLDTIAHLRKNHTVLLATHSLEQAKNADAIAVFSDGRIAQLGTHDQLEQQGGEYARLRMQTAQ